MSSVLYQQYIANIFTLAKTIRIKHHAAAVAINQQMVNARIPVAWDDLTTWKYYLNLAGLYHPVDRLKLKEKTGFDTMRIRVAGNSGPVWVNFDQALIAADPAIANEYRYDTAYYRELVYRYPEYEDLILGILNPVSLSVSLSAKDNTILYCGGYFLTPPKAGNTRWTYQRGFSTLVQGDDLIESHEYRLIDDIQEWVSGFFYRWDVPAYHFVADLFYTTQLALLYSQLPKTIINLRLANCRTPRAHTFHIKMFLEANGKLGDYVDLLKLPQQLYLYRNIQWLEAHAGKELVFDDLVKNLLTPMNIPLSKYELIHDVTNVDEDLSPIARMRRLVVNFKQIGTGRDVKNLDVVTKRLNKVALFNEREEEFSIDRAHALGDNSLHSRVETKVLESAMVDFSDRTPYPLLRFLMNQWVYTASHGKYVGTIYVTDPVTGDRIQLTPNNALILALYCLNKGYTDITLTTIPAIKAKMVPRRVDGGAGAKPTRAEIKQKTYRLSDDSIDGILGTFQEPVFHPNAKSFYTQTKQSHRELSRRHYATIEEINRDAFGEALMALEACYWSEIMCDLVPVETQYTDWFTLQGITFDGYTTADYGLLASRLVRGALGLDFDDGLKPADIQKAVLAIMMQLLSYTVNLIRSINTTAVIVVDFYHPRLANYTRTVKTHVRVPIPHVEVISSSQHTESLEPVYGKSLYSFTLNMERQNRVRVPLLIPKSTGKTTTSNARLQLPIMRPTVVSP